MVSSRTLAETFLEISKKPYAEKGVEEFLKYIQSNNLGGLLPQVIEHVQSLESIQKEYNTLRIYTPFLLDVLHLAEVKKNTKAADAAEVQQHIDESVIGGFSAEYQGNLYDGSLGNQVTRLKTMLLR